MSAERTVAMASSSVAAAMMRADAARYAEALERERCQFLDMHTRTCLPTARLAVSTAVGSPPQGCEDPLWQALPALGDFAAVNDGGPVSQPTEVRIAHDSEALYVHFTCHEPEPERLRPARGEDPIYRTDCVELYLDTAHDHHHYFQFAVAAGGDRQCQKMSSPLDSMRWERKVNSEAAELDWSADTRVLADRWLCQMSLPLAALEIDPDQFGPVGVNFARLRTVGFDEGSSWNRGYQGNHSPWAFGELYLQAPLIHVVRTDLGTVKLWENRGSLRLRKPHGGDLTDATLSATLLVEVIGGEEQTDQIYRGEVPVAIEAGLETDVSFDFPFDRDEWRWTYLRLSIVHDGRTVYRGGYRFGRGQVGWLLPVDYRRHDAAAPNPSPDDPDFMEKKRAYIIRKQPAFRRLTTTGGASSDFVLAAEDGSIRFDLMQPGILQRIADYLYALYDNDVDRLLGANFFIHQSAVMTYANKATGLADSMGPLSVIRLGAGQCCVFANALLGLLEKMKCEATGKPYRGSRWGVPGHVTTVVELNGRLVHLDPSIGRFYFLRDNETLAGPDELLNDAEICLRGGKYLARCYADNERKAGAHYYRPQAGVFPPGAPAE